MSMRLVQLRDSQGNRRLAAATEDTARRVETADTVYDLARIALGRKAKLDAILDLGEEVDLAAALAEKRVLAPIDHPDSARLMLSGTGLTHLGSADARDRMHAKAEAADASDSLKMFRLGLDGGKPEAGELGVQPEWFYKGDGQRVVGPEETLFSPDFALDGGEEPELAGIYLIAEDGTPWRIGICLANEFSDHVTERSNYLYLAHSKLRPAALGPEILLGEPPADIRGRSRLFRDGAVIWEKPFLTGEANMSHSLRNLEYHHFKYAPFRRPGDVHVHFFGTATLSCADGVTTRPGDVFEIAAAPFSLPLRNPLGRAAAPAVRVGVL